MKSNRWQRYKPTEARIPINNPGCIDRSITIIDLEAVNDEGGKTKN